jgi:hypothetical protein
MPRTSSSRTDERASAERLAKAIRLHWAALGHEITATVIQGAYNGDIKAMSFLIKTNLINGLPPALAHAPENKEQGASHGHPTPL